MCGTRLAPVLLLATLLAGSPVANALDTSIADLERPVAEQYVLDGADLLPPDDETLIEAIARDLFDREQTYLYVVTIRAMADHWRYGDIRIETFAHLLFDQWAIGTAEKNDGILLLISRDDRKARIQLGAAWGRDYDQASQVIMNRTIIPAFKRGDFVGGIRGGALALSDMARGDLPSPSSRSRSSGPGGTAPVVPVRKTSLDWLLVIALIIGAGIVIAMFGIMISSAKQAEYRRLHRPDFDDDEDSDDGDGGRSNGGRDSGFWHGFLFGHMFSGHSGSGRSGHSGGGSWGGGFGGGGFGGGGFSGGGGGGFSGGGGASGGW